MPPLKFEQVAGLFAALDQGSSRTRLAALRALVRLDLFVAVREELGKRVIRLLDIEESGELPLEEVLEAALYLTPFSSELLFRLTFLAERHEEIRSFILRKVESFQTPQEEAVTQVEFPPPNPELEVIASEVVRQMRKQGYLEETLSEKSFRADLIPYLPNDLATDLVTALFGEAVDYALTVIDAPPGNDIVANIALCDRFTPDTRGLFFSYCELWTSESVTQELLPPWAVRWLIAWTVSRSATADLLLALEPVLLEGSEQERELAARLIEDSLRYANQTTPPQFGGGEEPPDITPHLDKFWKYITLVPSRSRSDTFTRERPTSVEPQPVSDPPDNTGGGGEDVGEGTLSASEIEPYPSYLNELEIVDVSEDEPSTNEVPQRVVNTGFAPSTDPDELLDPAHPLAPNTAYFFWIDIGKPDKRSMEVTKSDVPQAVPGVSLTVTVVGFSDGILVQPNADVGQMYVGEGGNVSALRQPLGKKSPPSEAGDRRLFFPVRTPTTEGLALMRCQIFCGRVLLQSRLIEVNVSRSALTRINVPEFGFRSNLDYKLSQMLDQTMLNEFEPHRLSIMLNKNSDGTHSFHFYGADEGKPFKRDDVRFTEGTLTGLISRGRETLQKVSWNTKNEWKEGDDYRYKDRQLNLPRLYEDLKNLARWGFEFYTTINLKFGSGEKIKALQKLMAKPGQVQIAMKESASYILPAALIYDYPLDSGAKSYSYCQEFETALTSKLPLSEVKCFKGECPTHGDLEAICPSGFWGYRHQLGMPLSLGKAPDIGARIKVNGALNMAVGVATDMKLLGSHKVNIEKLQPKPSLTFADTRKVVFEMLKKSPHVVYFYCHGGYARDEDAPYLQIGAKENPELILQSNLQAYQIIWNGPRPLVFINGCHTTALAPQQSLEFITPLVTYCGSAGVIGTEITIWEELATVFAEELLQRFFKQVPIGEAVRQARLKLLSEGNPLGLVYIPFVQADLKLEYAA